MNLLALQESIKFKSNISFCFIFHINLIAQSSTKKRYQNSNFVLVAPPP